MPSKRETALCALQDALLQIAGSKVGPRNSFFPETIHAAGLLILRDGEPGEPEILKSPVIYTYEHQARIDCVVQVTDPATASAQLDALLGDIAQAVALDDSLGGAVDLAVVGAPLDDEDHQWVGAEDLRGVVVPVTLTYATSNPLL